ncbi:MAG TPA: phospholipase [Solirubrobacterales bacterium]|nr:phospholipase [Solirubrobacterales bacterium]
MSPPDWEDASDPSRGRLPRVAELPHLVREPAAEPAGALILLHGRAVDERDLHPMLDELDPERRLLGITPGAPLTDQPPGGRHWYVIERIGQPDEGTFVSALTALCRFLDDQLRERGIPWEKTVIGGFSQGAAVACAVALGVGRPRAAGLLMMSGFYPMVRGWRLDPEAKSGMPAYVTHGSYDPVIPVGFGRKARDLLEAGELQVSFRETRAQHSVDFALIGEMRDWIAAVIAGEVPRAIA